ncbi:hypothetical protein SAMN02745111_02210 [Eubacterium uniforme]|uniref:ABC-2 type transport system permease protein n=1 Tax=Eubacterium uniforme TaxID=39495 RepID=A0A1T4W2U0_9FIRM|nr:hypothetical protein [Eubacterium uniforme]SKA71385.1 hypothetical protein SAMN02745111_02210 [Eubacterium uniforme]
MKFVKTIIIGIIVGAMVLISGINVTKMSIYQYILYLSFTGIGLYKEYIGEFFYRYMPLLVFNIIYGIYIYRHFCCASVYFFSRKNNRVHWFVKEIIDLYIHALLYIFMICLVGMMVIFIDDKCFMNFNEMLLSLNYILIYSLYLLITTLAINIVAIVFNSTVGFISVQSVIFFLIAYMMNMGGKLEIIPIKKKYLYFLKLNPVSNLLFQIHRIRVDEKYKFLLQDGINIEMRYSILYYLLVLVVLVIIGCVIVHKKEFIINDREDLG